MGGKINKRWSDKSNGISFVCHKIPFVCHEPSHSIPIICIYTPSVRNCAFSTGFTLVELLITLTIVGLLATFGVPAMTTFINNERITTQTNDFIADLNFARSEALKRGNSNIVVCATVAGGGGCAAAGATAFRNGRLVFLDVNANNDFDAGDQILRQREALEGTTNSLNAIAPGDSPIAFGTQGRVTRGTNGAVQINYAICDSRGYTKGRQIQLGVSGQVRLLKTSDSSYLAQC